MSNRIGTVLRIRALSERLALGALAQGRQEAQRADELVAARRAAAQVRQPPTTLTPLHLRALQLQGLAGHELVSDAVLLRDQADARVDELQAELSRASVRRKSVERLAERRGAEAATAARIAADRTLDEMALLRRSRS